RLVARQVEDHRGRRAVEEVDAAQAAAALQEEAADAGAGQTRQGVVAPGQRGAADLPQALAVPAEVAAPAAQPLARRAQGVQADADGPPVGPEGAVALKLDAVVLAVAAGVAAEKDVQNTWHPVEPRRACGVRARWASGPAPVASCEGTSSF